MILSALVIALPGMQGREYGMNPAATSSENIQPNPTLNTNVTWSTFYNGWNPLEYSNGTANISLDTGLSTLYANPIAIDPAKISGITGRYAPSENSSNWAAPPGNAIPSEATESFTNASGKETITLSGADDGNTRGVTKMEIPISALPSNNPQYDYFTMIYNTSGKILTGQYAYAYLTNDTNNGATNGAGFYTPNTYGTGDQYFSVSLGSLTSNLSKYGNMNISANSFYQFGIVIYIPNGTSGQTWSITLQALMITESPVYIGSNATSQQITEGNGNIRMAIFDPNFQWTKIVNGGYSVATSQPLRNLTTQQSAINTLNYIEQVEYQGTFSLPTAPDISYGSANITEHFNVSTSQTQVLDINGVSYLSTISGKNNTVLLLSSVNPNGQTQFLQIVDYTQSQWTSISSPPGIFTLPGIEYYWEEFIIAILAIVGVGGGAAAKHASNLRRVK